jgi:hypothetical protein
MPEFCTKGLVFGEGMRSAFASGIPIPEGKVMVSAINAASILLKKV